MLLEGTGFARYSPTGHIIFARLGTLYAQPFDLSSLELKGSAVPVLQEVQMLDYANFYADFDVSASGALVYVPGSSRPADRSLLWVDRQGKTSQVTSNRQPYGHPRLSPDGQMLSIRIQSDPLTWDLWVLDLKRDSSRPLLKDTQSTGLWSPDGLSLISLNSGFQVVRIPADGSAAPKSPSEAEPLANADTLNAWSPDGRTLVLHRFETHTIDLWTLPAEGGKPAVLLSTPYRECCASLSPDGRFMAYASNESGSFQIYVSPFPGPVQKKYQISREGGFQPMFSRNGRELFYRSQGDRPKIVSVPIETTGGAFRSGTPQPLFDDVFAIRTDYYVAQYDASPDGQRFLFIEEPPAAPGPNRVVLIPDWASEMKTILRSAQR